LLNRANVIMVMLMLLVGYSAGSLKKQAPPAVKQEPIPPEVKYPIVPLLATQDVEASMMTAFGPLRSSARYASPHTHTRAQSTVAYRSNTQ
jgi:hypothetical protein